MAEPRLWKRVVAAFSGGRSAEKSTKKSTTAAKKTTGTAKTKTGTAKNTARAKNADQSKATKSQPAAKSQPRQTGHTAKPTGAGPTPRSQSATRTTAAPIGNGRSKSTTPRPLRTPRRRRSAVARNSTVVTPELEFDREIEQYNLAEAELSQRLETVSRQLDECRRSTISIADSVDDIRRLSAEATYLSERLTTLRSRRDRYCGQRDELLRWGPTDDWVVAGSVVTVSFGNDGQTDTFVLTERESDSEYDTLPYDSVLGQALRRKRPGDSATYQCPDGRLSTVTVISVRPGFRAVSSANTGRKQ